MEAFKERLLVEEADLNEKIIKLENFIGSPAYDMIDELNKALLKVQLAAMKTYHLCLVHRIERD